MEYVIYLFRFPNGKQYVGRTNDFESRLASHRYSSKKRRTLAVHKAINKHGWDNVEKTIIDTADTLEEAIAKEFEYIVKYDCIRNGYNLTLRTDGGGDQWLDRKDTQEFKDFQQKMSSVTSGEKNGMYGKTQKEESKDKMKEKAKGRFSLPWFIERYGEEIGTQKYEDRRAFLKSRKLKHSPNGKFTKQS
jgi:group I intron endonuclease